MLKLSNFATRPMNVIQCGYAGESMTAWNRPYHGVREFFNGADGETCWPYLRTSGFPGWVSGHATVTLSGAKVLERWFSDGGVKGANYGFLKKGMSRTEPMLLKGTPGYVAGVMDVPNSGPATVGFSPTEDVSI